jgi:hypothetical protein
LRVHYVEFKLQSIRNDYMVSGACLGLPFCQILNDVEMKSGRNKTRIVGKQWARLMK